MKIRLNFCLIILMCILSSCTAKEKNRQEDSPVKEPVVSDHEVVWTLDDYAQIPQENVKKLNQALYQKGYDVAVRFEYITESGETEDTDEMYQKELIQRIQNQETDIVNCGWESDDFPGGVAKLIRMGYFLPLDQWLETEEGQQVYQLYDEEVWKAGQVDGVTYGLPNEGNYDSANTMVALNTQYIPDDLVSSWDGTWEGLYQMLEKTEIPQDIMPIAGGPFWFRFMNGHDKKAYYINDGLVYDVAEAKVSNPFALDEFHSYLSFLNRCYKKGWLSKVEMGGVLKYTEQEMEDIENLRYVININTSENEVEMSEAEDVKKKIIYKPLNFCVGNHIGLSTAVCKDSPNTAAALALLKALRTEDDLANLLVWGSSDSQEILKEDGKASEQNKLARGYGLGLVDGIFQEAESPVENMREYKKGNMQSAQRVSSALAGFYPDYSGMEQDLKKYCEELDRCAECWKKKNFEKEYLKAVKDMQPYEESLCRKINKQIKKWQKNKTEG